MNDAVILLVEDNPLDVELTLDAFQQAGLRNRVEVACNGETALDYLFGRGAYADRKRFPLPHLVLLDLKLPGISGLEALAEIKHQRGLKRIPVVVLTSSREEGDRVSSYDSGANSYLVKPIDFGEFLRVVRLVGDYWLTLNVEAPVGEMAGPGKEAI